MTEKENSAKNIHIFRNTDEAAAFALDTWSTLSRLKIKAGREFSAALSGGTTPVPFYRRLSEEKHLPWDKTHIFIVDERFVPYESEESNYRMINRTLLLHVNVIPRNIHAILTSELSPEAAASRYEKDLISWCRSQRLKKPRFDLVLLGIGEDGHTASLFPGTAALDEKKLFAVPVISPSAKIKERITITFPVINSAEHVIFMISGENKASIVQDIIENSDSVLPAARVAPEKGKLIFLLDEAAASLLSKKGRK